MVFNIYGEKTYNDSEIYNGISNDPELSSFFISLSEYYDKMSQSIKAEKKKMLEEKKPGLDEINDLITRITKTGITISESGYIILSITSLYPAYTPFQKVKFNDVNLLEEDWNYLSRFDKNSVEVPLRLDKEYKKWIKENRNIDKEIKKTQNKIIKNNDNLSQFTEDNLCLNTLLKTEKIGKNLKSRIEFIKSLDYEQKSLLRNLYNLFYETREKYVKFRHKENSINKEIEERITNNMPIVYDEFINSKLVMIDIDLIIEKLFKVILMVVLKEFKQIYTREHSRSTYMNSQVLRKEVIEWFINQNSDKFKEMFDSTFEDMELVVNTLVKKLNKKI